MKQVIYKIETFRIENEVISKFDFNLPLMPNEIVFILQTPLDFLRKMEAINYSESHDFTPFKGWIDIPVRINKYQNSDFRIHSIAKYQNSIALLCANNCIVIFVHKTKIKLDDFIQYNKKLVLNTDLFPKEITMLIIDYYGLFSKQDWIYSLLFKI